MDTMAHCYWTAGKPACRAGGEDFAARGTEVLSCPTKRGIIIGEGAISSSNILADIIHHRKVYALRLMSSSSAGSTFVQAESL